MDNETMSDVLRHLEFWKRQHHTPDDLNQLIKPFEVLPTVIPASGILNDPRLFAPEPEFIWSVMRISAQTFTGGTIGVYKGTAQDTQLVTFGSAGSYWFNNQSLFVFDKNRPLTFQVLTSLTGNAYIGVEGISIHKTLIGKWLMAGG